MRDKYPTIPWRQVIGMRNILIHHYFGMDEFQVWKTATEDLSKVKVENQKLYQELKSIE